MLYGATCNDFNLYNIRYDDNYDVRRITSHRVRGYDIMTSEN